ncbi:hypothetical protein KDA14_01745 [Candidatus Saccharibacteria bacterium]|nr:hypothetical protein [Candidatus Saccharibacteria bacterium]
MYYPQNKKPRSNHPGQEMHHVNTPARHHGGGLFDDDDDYSVPPSDKVNVYWTVPKIHAIIIGVALALLASVLLILLVVWGLSWAYSEGTLMDDEFNRAVALVINLGTEAALAARYEQACMFSMLCNQLRAELPGITCDWSTPTLDATCPHMSAFDGPITSGDVSSALNHKTSSSSSSSSPIGFETQKSKLDHTTPSSPTPTTSTSSW